MQRNRDIYKAPDADSGGEKSRPSVDHPVLRAQARMKRNVLRGVLLMVLVLAGAAFLAHVLEEREQEEQDLLKELVAPVPITNTNRAPLRPMLVEPEASPFADALSGPADTRLTEADRQRVAEAMGEVRIARQYLETREWDGAETHSRRALEIWPEMNVARRLMGFLYIQRGQFDQAIATLETALQNEPFSAEVYNNLASAYMRKWELEKAEDLLNTSLEVRPGYAVAHINLGLLYLIVGRYEDTIDHLERSLELLPNNAGARNNLAVALLRVGRYDESREQLQQLIADDPARASAYFNVAITYVLEQQFQEAMQYIELGRRYCSPVACRNYLADSDFDPLRGMPAFQAFINGLYPDLPQFPEG